MAPSSCFNTRGGNQRHATLLEICEWILDSWNAITPECILNGFRVMAGETEDLAAEDEAEEEVVQNLAGLYLNFMSGDEFDGFGDEDQVGGFDPFYL